MGIELAVYAAIGIGTAAIGYSQQRKAQKQANRERDRQNKIGQAQAANENRNRIRKQITQLRMAQAQQETQAEVQGMQGSSAQQGASASVSSQFATGVGSFNADVLLGQMFNESQARLGKAQSREATGQALQGLGSSMFSAAGGFKAFA
jgi:Flp pilus assembly protein TadB